MKIDPDPGGVASARRVTVLACTAVALRGVKTKVVRLCEMYRMFL